MAATCGDEGYARLCEVLRGCAYDGRLAVAFSGGVDSSLVLAAAHEALEGGVLAVTAVSRAFPEREHEEAQAFCEALGVRQVFVDARETELPAYRSNPPDRCYHCKRALMEALLEVAHGCGFEALAEGSNLDDLGDHRPGARAVEELGVRSPLREAGLGKEEIRAMLRARGFSVAEKPSFACLATRFPYGEPITEEGLARVDAAERWFLERGFAQVRVRVPGGNLARVEVAPGELGRLAGEELRTEAHAYLKGLGFSYAALDLLGYRTGSMNEVLGV